jgi:hypothetical protein
LIQRAQVFIQERVITGVLGNRDEIKPPFLVKLLRAVPILRRIPARVGGIGHSAQAHPRTGAADCRQVSRGGTHVSRNGNRNRPGFRHLAAAWILGNRSRYCP